MVQLTVGVGRVMFMNIINFLSDILGMSVVRNCHNHLMVTSVTPVFHSSAGGSQVGPQISSRENSLPVPLFLVSLAFHSRFKIIHIISG